MTDAVVRDIIVKARELLGDKSHWTKRAYARNARYKEVTARSHLARSYCSIGALIRATMDVQGVCFLGSEQSRGALDVLCGALPQTYREVLHGFGGVSVFNDADTTKHADVLALFDRAIAHTNTETVS